MTRYELMNQCWNANPADRPSFEEISQFVGQMMEDKICQVSQHYITIIKIK